MSSRHKIVVANLLALSASSIGACTPPQPDVDPDRVGYQFGQVQTVDAQPWVAGSFAEGPGANAGTAFARVEIDEDGVPRPVGPSFRFGGFGTNAQVLPFGEGWIRSVSSSVTGENRVSQHRADGTETGWERDYASSDHVGFLPTGGDTSFALSVAEGSGTSRTELYSATRGEPVLISTFVGCGSLFWHSPHAFCGVPDEPETIIFDERGTEVTRVRAEDQTIGPRVLGVVDDLVFLQVGQEWIALDRHIAFEESARGELPEEANGNLARLSSRELITLHSELALIRVVADPAPDVQLVARGPSQGLRAADAATMLPDGRLLIAGYGLEVVAVDRESGEIRSEGFFERHYTRDGGVFDPSRLVERTHLSP